MLNRRLSCVVLAVLTLAGGCASRPQPVELPAVTSTTPFGELYALWVTRWDYRTKEDVLKIVQNAADLGITDLVFQVRGQADAFYDSRYEVWGHELLEDLGPGAAEPGFDPLAVACSAAHERNMRLHAWINVMPLWKGKTPPRNRKHLYYTRPDFRLYDRQGTPQPLNDHYVIVNPTNPQVHTHITDVVRDIVSRYPVDGIHMDYIRFVSELMKDDMQYPGDPDSRRRFNEATGLDATKNQQEFRKWIMSRITDLVREIHLTIQRERPSVMLTAAVWRDYNIGKNTYLQDYPGWIERGLLEAAMPMIYTTNNDLFETNARDAVAIRKNAALLAGVGTYRHDPDQTIAQFEIARKLGANGACIFAYHALFDSDMPGQSHTPEQADLRTRRREAIRAYIAAHHSVTNQTSSIR